MIKSWNIDLRHFLMPDGKVAPLPPRGRRLFDYWTEIVSQATQYDDPTTLRCRRRPGPSRYFESLPSNALTMERHPAD